MISKNSPEHPALIKEWDDFVNSHYDNDEKWKWIMDHYDTFDRPDEYDDQKKWLIQSGFSKIDIGWRKEYWVNYLAYK